MYNIGLPSLSPKMAFLMSALYTAGEEKVSSHLLAMYIISMSGIGLDGMCIGAISWAAI